MGSHFHKTLLFGVTIIELNNSKGCLYLVLFDIVIIGD